MSNVLIGSVRSSKILLEKMIECEFPVDLVFALDESYSSSVSGYEPIHEIAAKNNIPYRKFRKINDRENIELIKSMEPDYIFVVGLSQLVSTEIINCAKKGVVGFHPTPLPKFRGRAALVWQILLGVRETKCTYFFIDGGMDSGDILGQEPYVIGDTDYASDVREKLCSAIERLSVKVLRQIMDGTIMPQKQNEAEATYLLVRRPEDGWIDWKEPVEKVQRLIRAVSHPYPGAFGMYDGKHKITIWRADYMDNKKYIGIPGQICDICDDHFDVLGQDGLIRVWDYENVDEVKMLVGHKLR